MQQMREYLLTYTHWLHEEVAMKKEIYNVEGIEIEVERTDKNDTDAVLVLYYSVVTDVL